MLDFYTIKTKPPTKSNMNTVISPEFLIEPHHEDLMVRGKAFYAVWDEKEGLWSRSEGLIKKIVDGSLRERQKELDGIPTDVLYLKNFSSNKWTEWQKYVKSCPDDYHILDRKIIFSNSPIKKTDYSSKRLPYPLEEGSIAAYEELIGTLYEPNEREKLEWSIGAIISGDSRKIQKFIVLYGEAGSGKSTVLNIIEKLFEGYWTTFNAKELASNNNSFALEAFKDDPLVAIQHDGDLSKIEDNTLLNSIISHETLSVNEKFKSKYQARFECFLYLGTNRPVKITEAKSGILRRLIDVNPSGKKVSADRYLELTKQIEFELGAIADHCLKLYKKLGRHYYDNYRPVGMIEETNDFFNFMEDNFDIFAKNEITTLLSAWNLYKDYVDENRMSYTLPKRVFKAEIKNYFDEYYDRLQLSDGTYPRNVYAGFKKDKFFMQPPSRTNSKKRGIDLIEQDSILDVLYSEQPAQYAVTTADGRDIPEKAWDKNTNKLKNIDTKLTHYVKPPENHIVIDFDLKNEKGEKDYDLNIVAASHWPKTYCETSKGGSGIHLHYIYDGDISRLSRLYDTDIEIKTFNGNSALRRRVSKCNNEQVAHLNSGLPLKGEPKVIDENIVMSEKTIRNLILRNLNKEIHPATAPSIDFIKKILDEAYESGVPYDVSDLRPKILSFAMQSTHQKDKCINQVVSMHFESLELPEDQQNKENYENDALIFYDVEVFPNLFIVVWKKQGAPNCVKMINPTPEQIEQLTKMKLVGFNNRKYDNHILYGRMMGYSNEMLYRLSQKIIVDGTGFFSEAYNLSYTDIYDFSSVKQSLKKFEIQLGIHHQELGLPWDQPVPEDLWNKVADYCINDVVATEAVFEARKGDFVARQIQVKLIKALHGIDMTMNDTTNTLSGKLIFGRDRKPQSKFNWRDMSLPVGSNQYEEYRQKFGKDYIFRVFNERGLPEYRDYEPGEKLPNGWSILPFFPEYKYDKYKPKKERSTYLGEVIGEGGKVYSEPGMYYGVWDGDIASQHPHSAIAECVFGEEYTKVFEEIVEARVAIKHKDFERASQMLNGALTEFLNEEYAKDLAQALKIIINAIYGLTSASFDNLFKDPNNIDNIVAKRGSLFMTLLKREVEEKGYQVCHIKTDSIKIPNADDIIQKFVIRFGKEYGYDFETEAYFNKFFLENKAVYVGRTNEGEWITTGDRFAVPYVRKTLFTKEPIAFEDMCETKQVTSALYIDFNENLPNVEKLEKEYDKLKKAVDKETPLSNHDISLDMNRLQELEAAISTGHNYVFIGRIGLFCPMKYGTGGGDLVRENGDKFAAAEGAKGYHWMEAESVKLLGKEDCIDTGYYKVQVDSAFDAIVNVLNEQHEMEPNYDAIQEAEEFLVM